MLCNAFVVSRFVSIPSVIYGGDSYYQHGVVEHIRSGANVFESSSMRGGFSGYLPLYPLLVAFYSDLNNVDSKTGMLAFSSLLVFVGCVFWYLLGWKIFGERKSATVLSWSAVMMASLPIIKYTQFAYFVFLPLFIYYLYSFYKENSKLNSFALGVVLGLASITHGVMWIGGFIIAHIFWIQIFFADIKNSKLKRFFGRYLLFIFPALALFFVGWHRLFLNIETLGVSNIMEWSVRGYFSTIAEAYGLANGWFNTLFSFSDIKIYSVLTFLFYMGLCLIFKSKEKSIEQKFCKVFFIFAISMLFSFLLTVPLLGTHFAPDYCYQFWGRGAKVIVATLAFSTFVSMRSKNIAMALLFAGALFGVVDVVFTGREENVWYYNGLREINPRYTQLKEFIDDNIDKETVFLSSKNVSFLVNSLTGVKIVANRWAHQIDPTQDFSKRDMHAALILYGDNDKLRQELIDKYDVEYFVWNKEWQMTMLSVDESGKINGTVDPFNIFYSPENESLLQANNVSYERHKAYVDPAYRGKEFPRYDLLIVNPYAKSKDRDWNQALDPFLEEVWSFKDENGVKTDIIYKIKKS